MKDKDDTIKAEMWLSVRKAYENKIDMAFAHVKGDILRQITILMDKNQPIPEEIEIKFTLNLK